MSFPRSIVDESAFDDFFNETAKVTGTRKTGSTAARSLSLQVPCAVSGGELESLPAGAISPTYTYVYSVRIRRSDWPEPYPPTMGLTVAVEGYPRMSVKFVSQKSVDEWELICTSAEEAP